MPKIATKTLQFSIYDRTRGKAKYVGDAVSYKRPEVETLADGFTGAGIMGEIDIPALGQLGAMEGEITLNKMNADAIALFTPEAHTIEVRWVTNTLDQSTGNSGLQANKEILRILPKSIELGDIEGNETNEGSMTYEIIAYEYILDGRQRLKIDKLNNVFKINGKDYSEEIRKML